MTLPWADAPIRPARAQLPSLTWRWDAPVTALAFSRRSGYLAAASGDGIVRIASPKDPSDLNVVEAHKGAVLALQHDLAADAFVSGGDDGRLVQSRTDGSCQTLLHEPRHWIDTIAVADTVRAVALGREVRLLDASGKEIGRTDNHPSSVSGLAFNPKGRRLAVSHYDGVTLWWTASLGGTPLRYKWRGSHIGISWSPDGKYLMTATQERELHGWRLADGSDLRMSGYAVKIRSFDWIAKPPFFVTNGADSVTAWSFSGRGPKGRPPFEFGHRPGILVSCVAAHPKRPLVAFGYDDGEVRIAELPGSRVIEVRRGDGTKVTAVAWSADGGILGAGTEDGTVSAIDLPPDGLW